MVLDAGRIVSLHPTFLSTPYYPHRPQNTEVLFSPGRVWQTKRIAQEGGQSVEGVGRGKWRQGDLGWDGCRVQHLEKVGNFPAPRGLSCIWFYTLSPHNKVWLTEPMYDQITALANSKSIVIQERRWSFFEEKAKVRSDLGKRGHKQEIVRPHNT